MGAVAGRRARAMPRLVHAEQMFVTLQRRFVPQGKFSANAAAADQGSCLIIIA